MELNEETPPDGGGAKGEVVRHIEKKDGKWRTWISIDGESVPGTEVVHRTMYEAKRWHNTERDRLN